MVLNYNKTVYDEIGHEEMDNFLKTMTKIRNITCKLTAQAEEQES